VSNQKFTVNEKVFIPKLNQYATVVEVDDDGKPKFLQIAGKVVDALGLVITKLGLISQVVRFIISIFSK